MSKIMHIENHQWKFDDEEASSKVFDILMLSELGNTTGFDIFNRFNIYITGTVDGKDVEIKVAQIAIDPTYKEILIRSKDDNVYDVNLDKSVAQFVQKYWDTN